MGPHLGPDLRTAAHVLLAVAGYNFARFQLNGSDASLTGRSLKSLGRIVAPSVAWLGILTLWASGYGWASVALLNNYLGPRQWSPAWRYWFVEALVLIVLCLTALLSVAAVRRLERQYQIGFAGVLLGLALVFRFDLIGIESSEPLLTPHRVVWLFVLGWLVQRVKSTRDRLAGSLVALASVVGFFDEPSRDAVVACGLLLLIWVPHMRAPRPIIGVAGILGAASLYIYLSHFQVYIPMLDRGAPPWLAVVVSLLVGILLWRGTQLATRAFSSLNFAKQHGSRGIDPRLSRQKRSSPLGSSI